jgi:hypothetical protein
VIVAVLGSGAGVSYAAEGAVPGDALYGFKLAVNEGVGSALAVTPEAQARWETRRVERRLEEAEVLVSAGRLDAAKSAVLEDKISESAAKAEEHLAKVDRGGRARQAAELGSELEGALRGHAAVIGRLSGRPADQHAVGAANIIEAAEKQAGRTAERRSVSERAVAVPDNRRAAEASLANAEKELAAVKNRLTEEQPRLTAKTADLVGKLIAQAEDAVGSGRSALAEEKFNEAFSAFQKAGREAQQAEMLISAEKKLPAGSRGRESPPKEDRGGGTTDDRRGRGWQPQRGSARFGRD